MNTAMPSIPSPDVLAAIAPRPAPVRAAEPSAGAGPAHTASHGERGRDAARGERDFATRLADEMRAEPGETAPARDRRPAGTHARDARRDRGDDVRTTPEARGDETGERSVDDVPAGAAETRPYDDEEGGDEPPPGGKDLPPWLAVDLLPTRPVPATVQPLDALDGDPLAPAAAGASVLAVGVAAGSATTSAVANAAGAESAASTTASLAAAPGGETDPVALAAARLAAADATLADGEATAPSASAASAAALAADADATPSRVLPAAASEAARLLALARSAESPEARAAADLASSARATPDPAQPIAQPSARPAGVELPLAAAQAAPTRRGFTLAAAAAAVATAAAAETASAPPPLAPRMEPAGPFALPLAGTTAAAPPAPSPVPAQLQLTTPFESPEWGRQLGERVNWLVGQDLTNAQLKLTPAHLGPIEIRISVADDQANVWFGTHSHVTREALEAAAPKLREMLAAQGYSQVNVNVDVSQQAFRERSQSAARYEPGGALASDADPAAPIATAAGPRAAGSRSRLDAYA